jgi:hypothetical protein
MNSSFQIRDYGRGVGASHAPLGVTIAMQFSQAITVDYGK